MFAERVGGLPESLLDFAVARGAWSSLPEAVKRALVRGGEEAAGPYPDLTATRISPTRGPGTGEAMSVEVIEVSDARLRKAWPERLYRVLMPLAGNDLRLTVEQTH